jgi:hypothetical protein
MRNLLRPRASAAAVGKAEHLKALLVEWMWRMDGPERYFSSNKYDNYQGRGDIAKVTKRRTWKKVPFWQSDSAIEFGEPSPVETNGTLSYKRNEYLYMGRTTPGLLVLQPIRISGPDARLFSTSLKSRIIIRQNRHVRVTVSLVSQAPVNMTSLQAYLHVSSSAGKHVVRLTSAAT